MFSCGGGPPDTSARSGVPLGGVHRRAQLGARVGAPKTCFSLSRGRGWLAPCAFTSGRETGEGLLLPLFLHHSHRIDNRAHELVGVSQHQGVRNTQQAYAESPQMIFLRGVPAHLVDLRMNPAVQFNGQSMFEAIEIEQAVFDAKLPAEFCAQSTVPQ